MKPARMQAKMVDIAALTADPANARRHNARNIEAIKTSLSRFGQQKPVVVDGKGQIVAGHGLVEAARELGWKQVTVVRTKLVGVEAAAFAIADNRTNELSEWDYESLAKSLEGIAKDIDLSELGWEPHELEPIMAADWNPPAVEPTTGAPALQRLAFTAEQWAIVEQASTQFRGDSEMTAADAVTEICRAYLGASA